MDFFTRSGVAAKQATGCAVVAVFEGRARSQSAAAFGAAGKSLIDQAKSNGDINGRLGDTLLLTHVPGLRCQRLLLIGCGAKSAFGRKQYRMALATAIKRLGHTRVRDAIVYLGLDKPHGLDAYYLGRSTAETVCANSYRFEQMKSARAPKRTGLQKVGLGCADRAAARQTQRGLDHGHAIAQGVELARDLANLPANICTPSYLARSARDLAKGCAELSVKILNEAEMKRLRMGAALSVTQGSDQPAKLIVLQYRGAPSSVAPVAVVGKGITFDSGGISLKPPPSMDEMKFDMCGAASTLGTMAAIKLIKPALNLVVVIPACENMPSGRATKPGDVVKSMSGKTIEILNTDAEGRLILCDGLTYAQRFKPSVIVDVATLTGACVIALGSHLTGLFSNSDRLANSLLEAGRRADDQAWRLPINEDYGKQLKSNFADFANVGGREAGAVTAACFLSRFVEGVDWAHLDIAGTAWRSGHQKGSTGRPVPLLVDFLLSRV